MWNVERNDGMERWSGVIGGNFWWSGGDDEWWQIKILKFYLRDKCLRYNTRSKSIICLRISEGKDLRRVE